MTDFPVLLEDVTAEWLGSVLDGTVSALRAEPVGTGQIGTCFRLHLDGSGVPATLVVKLPVPDPAARAMVAGAYRGEARFYRDLADTVGVRTPVCHFVDFDEAGDFVLLLQDMTPARQGDQIAGCTVAQALDAVENLAGLHGPRWCDPDLVANDGFLLNTAEDAALAVEFFAPCVDSFLESLGPLLDPADHELLRAVPAALHDWLLARSERYGLVHGDYRLDNLLFPEDGGPGSVAVDWQTLSLALPARDLSYFIATSLDPAVRRAHERDLVGAYHRALGPAVTAGYSLEECWDDYAFALLQVPLVCVFGQVYGQSTERGDRMFAAMVTRGCAAMRDLATLDRV